MRSIRITLTTLILLFASASSHAGSGIILVDGLIEDQPVRFVVDTGASEISIPYTEAIRMGLPVFEGPRTESTTASGPVGVYHLTLGSVTVGSVTLHDVAAHVSESALGVPVVLLGMSFLGRVNVCFFQGKLQISDPAVATEAGAPQPCIEQPVP